MFSTIETLQQLRQSRSSMLYFSRYRADLVDNGGARRVAQMLQVLDSYDLGFVSSLSRQESRADSQDAGRGMGLVEHVQQKAVHLLTRKFSAEFGRWVFFSDRLARRWVRALHGRQKPRMVLVDDPIFFPSLISYCNGKKIPIIALVQNIETLSRRQVVARYQQDLMAYEMSLLGQCRAVVTIAEEEAFLLRNLGMTVVQLPYYPPASIEQQLLEVRQCRVGNNKRDFLLMGSVGNPPTMAGMVRLLTMWREFGGIPGERLLVAGYGTETLRNLSGAAGIECLGSITSDQLAALLGRVRAGIVYQEEGAGALTRIAEYLLAGVPVVANQHAARSYHNLPGIVEITGETDLQAVLAGFRTAGPTVPLPSQVDCAPLRRLIDSVVKSG